jgi:hypothetical protein
MSTVACRTASAVPILAAGDDPLVLTRIYEPDIGAALWQRPRESWINALMQSLPDQSLRYSVSGSVDEVVAQLHALVPKMVTGRDKLVADVALVTEMFAVLMDVPLVGVRVATLRGPMCPKWHTDRVVARMVMSLGASGTEFINGWHPEPVEQALCQAGDRDVLILRGDLWPGDGGKGVWHRSPANDYFRLLLTVDAMSE